MTYENTILEHCRDDYKPLKSLFHLIPKSSLYRCVEDLVEKGYLEKSRGKYRTTAAGLSMLEHANVKWDELDKFCPLLQYAPTIVHRAVIELILAAIIARRDEIKKDHHPTFIMTGDTLKWKTWTAKFVCAVLGLDPVKTIILMTSESGRSILTRKGYGGETVFQRDVLQAPFVCFDEYLTAEPSIKKICNIYIQGEKQVSYENAVLTIEPVPLITLNPKEGKGLSLTEKTGFKEPQIRRSIIADLEKVEIPVDIKTKGEEILEKAKKHEALKLPRHKSQCSEYKDSIYTLLEKCMEKDAFHLVDIEMLLLLCSGMTAFLPEKRAVVQVLYDYLMVVETLGWVKKGWQMMVIDLDRLKGMNTEQLKGHEDDHSLSMEFDAFVERIALKNELKLFKQSFLDKTKHMTGAYMALQRSAFIDKCGWLETKVDKDIKEAKSIYEKLKVEYEGLLKEKDPFSEYRSTKARVNEIKNELERTVDGVKKFESEKKVNLEEARKFVNNNRGLILDLSTLKAEKERLRKELADKKSEIARLISGIKSLKSKADAWKKFEHVPYPDAGPCYYCGKFIDTAIVPIGASFTCPYCRVILVKNHVIQKQAIA